MPVIEEKKSAYIQLLRKFSGHRKRIIRIAWSPDGAMIASASDDHTVRIWDAVHGGPKEVLYGHTAEVGSVAWSPDGKLLASGSADKTILLWDCSNWKQVAPLTDHLDRVRSVAWSPDGQLLASACNDFTVKLWDRSGTCVASFAEYKDRATDVAWSPCGTLLASSADDGRILIFDVPSRKVFARLEGHRQHVFNIIWTHDGKRLLSSSFDTTIQVWNVESGKREHILEEHRDAVGGISLSHDGRLLASKSIDNTVRLWDTEKWSRKAIIQESRYPEIYLWHSNLAFHPTRDLLATLGEQDSIIRVWSLDVEGLLSGEPTTPRSRFSDAKNDVDFIIDGSVDDSVMYKATAKVVLVGESDVGKTCLARRIIAGSFDSEQEPTHGMNIWSMPAEQLSLDAAAPPGVLRDVVFWDMGGHNEYRIIHQLFLADTSVALILINPKRGNCLADAEDWLKRLEKGLEGRPITKLLVGTKDDLPGAVLDPNGVKDLVARAGFSGYFATSARDGAGIAELKEAIAKSVDWRELTRTNRPGVFQSIRNEISKRTERGDIAVSVTELIRGLGDVDPDAVEPVVRQLAAQGMIAETHLGGGERVLVLDVSQIERYAGSLIVAARSNLQGVPALEENLIASGEVDLPLIGTRLDAVKEQVVLQCVIQLLLAHGICLRHEGLLIFPSLFRTEATAQQRSPSSYSVSLSYEFTGPLDNIYSSLIVALRLSSHFGEMRLWQDVAEFEPPSGGMCGLKKLANDSGMAHLDIYFDKKVDQHRRNMFIAMIEQHLRDKGLDVADSIKVVCQCGHAFDEKLLQAFLQKGRREIICVWCETRNLLLRRSDGGTPIQQEMLVLKIRIEDEKNKQAALGPWKVPRNPVRSSVHGGEPIRVLHLSDLHMSEEDQPDVMAEHLIADLRDKRWINLERIDYLVISGDFTNRASPVEFGKAKEFVSRIIEAFDIDAFRCILTPGNHDVDWSCAVYDWKNRDDLDLKKLPKDSYVEQPMVVAIRNDVSYPQRFLNFSKHFYHPLIQQEYPLDAAKQFHSKWFPETGLQFIVLNSCTQIDRFFPGRATVPPDLLRNCFVQAVEQPKLGQRVLRLAVMHHPSTGNEKIWNTEFLEHLRKNQVRMCLHGHVHELRQDRVFAFESEQLYMLGGGTFGAVAAGRPEATPRLYNLLEIDRSLTNLTVHTRQKRTAESVWDIHAVYPAPNNPNLRRGFLELNLGN